MKTLPLNLDTWDLQLTSGNLVLMDQHASVAQDVASACRTFLGEPWYNQKLGLPYFQTILGQRPPASLIQKKLEQQAMTVEGVVTAKAMNISLGKDRRLTGTIICTSIYSATPILVDF